MKRIILGLVVLTSISAFASNPGIGTYSKYKISGEAISGAYKIEIVDFNESLQKFTNRYTTEVNGSINVEDEEFNTDEVNTREMNEMMLGHCEGLIGGKIEELKVPAGSFTTCRLISEDGQITYLGSVPFGFVKIITKDGVIELTDYEYK